MHSGIHIALHPLIERCRAAGHQSCPEQRMEQEQQCAEWMRGSNVKSDARAHQDEPGDVRLGQLEIIFHVEMDTVPSRDPRLLSTVWRSRRAAKSSHTLVARVKAPPATCAT